MQHVGQASHSIGLHAGRCTTGWSNQSLIYPTLAPSATGLYLSLQPSLMPSSLTLVPSRGPHSWVIDTLTKYNVKKQLESMVKETAPFLLPLTRFEILGQQRLRVGQSV